jgi:hypothetical protein
MNKCDAISDNMTAYRNLYYYLEGTFDGCEVSHVSRASNEEADNLANIRSQYLPVPQGVFWEEIIERSIKSTKVSTTGEQAQHQAIGLVICPFCITILYHNLLLFIDIFHI